MIDKLTDVYNKWGDKNNLQPLGSADEELLGRKNLTKEQKEFLLRSKRYNRTVPDDELEKLIFNGTSTGLTYLGRKSWKTYADNYANKSINEIFLFQPRTVSAFLGTPNR